MDFIPENHGVSKTAYVRNRGFILRYFRVFHLERTGSFATASL